MSIRSQKNVGQKNKGLQSAADYPVLMFLPDIFLTARALGALKIDGLNSSAGAGRMHLSSNWF